MSETIEVAKEHLEQAAEHVAERGGHGEGHARRTALLVALLAAALALTELGEKAAQNAYLTFHIKASDDWAVYQAKTVRQNIYAMFADTWEALPGADARRIAAARANAARMDDDPQGGNGRKQMTAIAKASEAARDAAFHRYHFFEFAVGGLQIAIVLASVSVVTRVVALALGAGVLGALASAFALVTAAGVL